MTVKNPLYNILIVDDNDNNLFTLKILLDQLEACQIIEAKSGEQALLITLEQDIQLILLDVQMPVMDGFETARHLKMTERTRDIPIVFLTAVFKAESFIKQGYAIGAVDYLTKPIDENLLLNRIKLYQQLFQRQQTLQSTLNLLQQSEARYRGYFESNLIGMATVTVEGHFCEVNTRFCKILGYKREELTGMHWHELTYPQDQALEQTKLAEVIEQMTEGYALDQRYLHKNGSTIHVSVSVRCIRLTSQSIDHFVMLLQDVTDKVRAREALIQSQKAAETANRAKSVFLAHMSHELRTPLNAIMGFSELMAGDSSISEEIRDNLRIINHSGEHLLHIINDVLALAKIEAGNMQQDDCVFDLPAVLQDLGKIIQAQAEEKKLRFTLEIAENLPRYIKVDLGKLRQVLINLLMNAIKFTEQGKVVLRASTLPGKGLENIRQILLEVEDSGFGIPVEQQEHVFKPFVQLEGSQIALKGGGLGLPICRSYVEFMGGEISIKSAPEKGTLFQVFLPVQIAKAAALISIDDLSTPKVIGLEAGQAEYRVLITEDHPENGHFLSILLKQVGFVVHEAKDGAEAVSIFQNWRPHFIWMDLDLPEIDGLEATRRIRSLPDGKDVKIVLLTASDLTMEEGDVFAAGCDDKMHKPYRLQEAFSMLKKHLSVRYTYSEKSEVSEPVEEHNDMSEQLAELPAQLKDCLYQAAVECDMELISDTLFKIQLINPDLADELQQLAQSFDYQKIIISLKHIDIPKNID